MLPGSLILLTTRSTVSGQREYFEEYWDKKCVQIIVANVIQVYAHPATHTHIRRFEERRGRSFDKSSLETVWNG